MTVRWSKVDFCHFFWGFLPLNQGKCWDRKLAPILNVKMDIFLPDPKISYQSSIWFNIGKFLKCGNWGKGNEISDFLPILAVLTYLWLKWRILMMLTLTMGQFWTKDQDFMAIEQPDQVFLETLSQLTEQFLLRKT